MKEISDYADILITAPFAFGYVWAADKFCKKYLGASRKNELLFLFFASGSWLFLDIACRRYSVLYIFSVILSPVFFMGLVVLLFRADKEKRILAASMLIISVRLVRNFCESFLSCLALFFRYAVKGIAEPFLDRWEIGMIGCAGCFLAILAVCCMSKHLESVFCGKSGKWYVILAVPLLLLTAVDAVAGWGASHGIMLRSGGNMGLYYDQIFSNAGFGILALLSMSLAGFYVWGMNRIYLEQEKNSRYHSQIAVYKMLEEQYSQTERLRHDMKNHIIALSGLFRNKEWEKLGDYLKNMEGGGLDTGGDMTGNKAVDALMYQKRKQAERENINWECDVQIPKGCCINEFDLCVLFGNILDNALEACERLKCSEGRFINIQAKTVKKCFLLEVKNSMDRMEKYAVGFTNKKNPWRHGIGLLNVRDVVHGYDGAVNMETENGIFVISILIPLNGTAHNIKTAV